AEATVLAEDGDDDDAVIATSAYSEHLANAAAELAGSEAVDPRTADLVSQLQDRMNEHRAAAAKAASRLGAKPSTANAGAVLAAVADGRPAGGSRRRRRAEGRRRGEGRRAKGEGRRQQEERRR